MKGHRSAIWAIGTVAVILSVATSCSSRADREIRADFDKIPDFFLGKRSGGQSFVRYTYARIGDISDESQRLQLAREFTDRLFSFDFKEHLLHDKLDGGELQDKVKAVSDGLWLLRNISADAKPRLKGFNIPLVEYWGAKFRYLETNRSCREWMAQTLKRPPIVATTTWRFTALNRNCCQTRNMAAFRPMISQRCGLALNRYWDAPCGRRNSLTKNARRGDRVFSAIDSFVCHREFSLTARSDGGGSDRA